MNYATLQDDFPKWVHRTDLAALLPSFVALFEARVGRRLRVRQMEKAFTGTITANKIALPSDWLAFRVLTNQRGGTIRPQTLDVLMDLADQQGTPTLYAIDGGHVRFNGGGTVTGTYYGAIPSLVTSGSNWLSTAAYDAYLFGTVSEAHLYAEYNEGAATMLARAEAALADVLATDNRDRFGGRLVARAM